MEFEGATDQFLEQVTGKLRAEGVETTNLDRIGNDVLAERADEKAMKRRRLEAMLGFDPDEADP